MRLLITGASGFLGRNALLNCPRSWQIFALYRQSDTDFLSFVKARQLDHVQPVSCDLTERYQVERALKLAGKYFDSCLYLASNTSIPGSIERPIDDLTNNVIGLLHVLHSCSFGHMVYLSSGAVYMGLTGLVGPTVSVSPNLPYAISKLAAEQYIRAFSYHHQTPQRATLVRFFGAYGPYEPPRKLYTRLVRRFALERNSHFTVTGDGENYIDAMYVDDAIRALLSVMIKPPAEGVRCVDLGVGKGESINSLVARAARTFDLEAKVSHEGSTSEYIQFTIDPDHFASLYQFRPTVSLEEGLRNLANHFATHSCQL